MADGSSGGLGGILFEAGKSLTDAGKKQAQQVANAAASQVTGNTKPLFGGQNATSGSFSPKPTGAGQMSQLDPFAGFGKMFEKNKPGGFGAKQPPVAAQPQFSQEDLDKMAAENKVKDEEEIAKRQAELRQLQQQLHDENYYAKIRDVGKDSLKKEREERAQQQEQEELEKQQQQQATQGQDLLPGNPLLKGQQLGTPVAVQQAKTQTEANRGTTG